MLLTRFLGYFARVAAPTRPAKIRFLIAPDGQALGRLANVRSVEFDIESAMWTVELVPGLALGKADKEEKTDG